MAKTTFKSYLPILYLMLSILYINIYTLLYFTINQSSEYEYIMVLITYDYLVIYSAKMLRDLNTTSKSFSYFHLINRLVKKAKKVNYFIIFIIVLFLIIFIQIGNNIVLFLLIISIFSTIYLGYFIIILGREKRNCLM